MKDKEGTVIYVGKAANVRKRAASYFRKSPQAIKQELMREHIHDIEITATASEHEAFLLESRLIKRFKPHFNVSLKDDKSFPFIKITQHDYPRVIIGRRKPHEQVSYFGPYTNSSALRQAVLSLRKVFPFCSCRQFPKNACLDYHLGLCWGPCVSKVSKAAYRNMIVDFKHFLLKGSKSLMERLQKRMHACVKKKSYEEAIVLRDPYSSLGGACTAKRDWYF